MTVLRRIIDGTVAVLGATLQGRRIRPRTTIGDGRVCVNLGCGLAVAPGWINVDASLNALVAGAPPWVLRVMYGISGANRYYTCERYCELLGRHTFVFHDLSKSMPFRDGTVDVFYSSHFFEHLFPDDARRLLQGAFAALRPGGLLRIAVPDLSHAVDLYRAGRASEMLNNYFFVEDKSSYLARHKYMYDFDLLAERLAAAGFAEIRRCSFAEGRVPDIALLDNRPDETLFVEAVKP